MPTVTIRPGGTIAAWPLGGAIPPVIGDPETAWSDDSDATYATSVSNAGVLAAIAQAPLYLDAIPAAATVNWATLHYRATMASTTRPDLLMEIRNGLRLAEDSPGVLYGFAPLQFAALGVAEQFTREIVIADDPGTEGRLDAFRLDGVLWCGFSVVNGMFGEPQWDASIYTHEVWLVVDYTTPGAPPCRGYPRDDRLGNSPRLYPPPKSRQGGPRNTGYL